MDLFKTGAGGRAQKQAKEVPKTAKYKHNDLRKRRKNGILDTFTS